MSRKKHADFDKKIFTKFTPDFITTSYSSSKSFVSLTENMCTQTHY